MTDFHADTKCINCYCDFADHTYVKDSIIDYKCPHPRQESVYGGFHGGDPRDFHPDSECCSQTELSAHKLACELWYEAEAQGKTPEPEDCPSGWLYDDDGKAIAHVLRCPYGIGISTWQEETFFEPSEDE